MQRNGAAHPGAALQRHRAGFVTRLTADAIDGAVLLAAGSLLLLFAGVVAFLVHPGAFAVPSLPAWVVLPVTAVMVAGYLGYGWSGPGRTVGKQITGLRVVDAAGNLLSARRALLRVLAYTLFPAGLMWSLVSRRNASLQDLLLRTAVVYDWSRWHTEAWTWGAPRSPR